MKSLLKKLPVFLLVLVSSLLVACGEMTKANKLVEAGNADVTEAEKLAQEAGDKIEVLTTKLDNFPEDRDELKASAQEIIQQLEKGIAKLREAASKYDEGSKTGIDAVLKEYLAIKSQEFAKHGQHLETLLQIPKLVLDTKIDDREELHAKFTEVMQAVDKLEKEWTDLASRAETIREANKAKFKS